MGDSMRFIADSMLGKLARWLRLLGYDARYEGDLDDRRIVEIGVEEDRVVLTRDRRLVERRACRDYVLVDDDDPQLQIEQLVAELDLEVSDDRWLTRCLICNAPLREVDRNRVRDEVPPYVFANHERFARCGGCDRVYWRGTHVSEMLDALRSLHAG